MYVSTGVASIVPRWIIFIFFPEKVLKFDAERHALQSKSLPVTVNITAGSDELLFACNLNVRPRKDFLLVEHTRAVPS